jgi:hypothetical protein
LKKIQIQNPKLQTSTKSEFPKASNNEGILDSKRRLLMIRRASDGFAVLRQPNNGEVLKDTANKSAGV